MTFKQAYEYAMEHSEIFAKHDRLAKAAAASEKQSACMIFSTAPGEVFYYGFDGVDWHKGKHTAKRAAYLIKRGEVYIID